MCGLIALAFERRPQFHDRLAAALDCLAHRGPDGEGAWSDDDVWLGHRRLAIIDLDARSNQPMSEREDGDLVMIYNGEIFNYKELRKDLAALGTVFRTTSDSEVLLAAYRAWGVDCFQRLNGMWSLVIWNRRERTLLLCRDRFGVKPLYYAFVGGGIAVASEPKALLALEPSLAEPNAEAIARLMVSTEAFSGPSTFYKRIHSVPPASWGKIDASLAIRFQPFWRYPETDPDPRPDGGAEFEEFSALFDSAVGLRLRSDVPVGLTLSGGLDSTAILASAAKAGVGLQSFTAAFGKGDERDWARSAAAKAAAPLEEVEALEGEWLDRLRTITWHMDAPGSFPPVFPLWNIMAKARSAGVPVLLEGQGADELLGGYVQFGAANLIGLAARARLGELVREAPRLADTFGWKLLLSWVGRLLTGRKYGDWQRRYGRGAMLLQSLPETPCGPGPRAGDPFALMRYEHSTSVLPALLQYGDAISMAHGIESRVPFLDYRLVDWVFSKRPQLFERGWTKSPLRSYLAQEGFSDHARRTDKKGFTTPTHKWIHDNRKWIAENVSENRNSPVWQFIDRAEGRKLLQPGDLFSASHAYKLITLQIWLEIASDWRRSDAPRPRLSERAVC